MFFLQQSQTFLSWMGMGDMYELMGGSRIWMLMDERGFWET